SLVRTAYNGNAMIGGTRLVTSAGDDPPFVEVKAAVAPPPPKATPFRPPTVSLESPRLVAASAPPSRAGSRPRPARAGQASAPPPPTSSPSALEAELASMRALLEELMSAKKPKDQAQALLGAAGFEGP